MWKKQGHYGCYGDYYYEPFCDSCHGEIDTEYYYEKDGKMYCEECFKKMVIDEIYKNMSEELKIKNGDFDLYTEYDCRDVFGFEEVDDIMYQNRVWFECGKIYGY